MPCIMAILQDKMEKGTNGEVTRTEVMEMIKPIHRQHAKTNIEGLEDIQQMLQDGEIQEPLVLYPRQADITGWYYQIFYTAQEMDRREHNQILCQLFPRIAGIRGEAVIVTNGAEFDSMSKRWDIDSIELGKTLWWYIKGGQDAREVANQRRFIDYLENM